METTLGLAAGVMHSDVPRTVTASLLSGMNLTLLFIAGRPLVRSKFIYTFGSPWILEPIYYFQ